MSEIKYKNISDEGEYEPVGFNVTGWTEKEIYIDLPKQLEWLQEQQHPDEPSSRKVKGIVWDEERSSWLVRVTVKNRQSHVGRFKYYDEACFEKIKAEREQYERQST